MWDALFLQKLLWIATQLGILTVLAVLIRSGNYRKYPAFTAYHVSNLFQASFLFFAYRSFGYTTRIAFESYWITQGAVLVLRGLAVSELCRLMLKRYSGIWTLAFRLLLACAAGTIVYAILVSDWHGIEAVHEASRALEMVVAGVVVALFLFGRYYNVPVTRQNRALAAGFCLYSCAIVLHNTFGNHISLHLFTIYNIGIMLTFCLSLFIWGRAMRIPAAREVEIPFLLPSGAYEQLSPVINERLRDLNERLISAWKMEARTP